jgi:hypothetical protein
MCMQHAFYYPMRTSIRPGPAGDQRVKRTKVLQFNLCSPSSERHFLFASDWLSVASVAAWISTLADGVLLFPALGARISVAHAPALVVPSHASKIGSPCDSFGCYHGWAVSRPIFPTIKTVIADAGHQSRKLTRLIKAEGYELRIVKRRKRAFEGCGSHLDRRTHLRLDRTIPSDEQGLRAPCADF